MTYLELAQKLRQESGIAGTGPSDVTSQTGILLRIVDWINDAWMDIQAARENWDWMWVEDATADTVASQKDYAPVADFSLAATDLAHWDVETMRMYKTADGKSSEGFLTFKPWKEFKQSYTLGDPDNSTPSIFTITPSGNIRLFPPPDDIYTLTCNYYKQPSRMTADSDVPELPSWLHDAIWARALLEYAYYDEAITVGQGAADKARRWIIKLDSFNRPQMEIKGTALA